MHRKILRPVAFWPFVLCQKQQRSSVGYQTTVSVCVFPSIHTHWLSAELLVHTALICHWLNSWHQRFKLSYRLDLDLTDEIWRFCEEFLGCRECMRAEKHRIRRDVQQQQPLEAVLNSHKSTKVNQSRILNTERMNQRAKTWVGWPSQPLKVRRNWQLNWWRTASTIKLQISHCYFTSPHSNHINHTNPAVLWKKINRHVEEHLKETSNRHMLEQNTTYTWNFVKKTAVVYIKWDFINQIPCQHINKALCQTKANTK